MRSFTRWSGVLAAVMCGCRSEKGDVAVSQPAATQGQESTAKLTVRSAAFAEGAAIPNKYTEDGQNVSPPLSWSGAPTQVKEYVLIVDDPDAPRPQPWVHWVLYR